MENQSKNYRKGSHTCYDAKVHLVWVTKYRKKILRGEIALRTRELIREICLSEEVEIIKGHYQIGIQISVNIMVIREVGSLFVRKRMAQ